MSSNRTVHRWLGYSLLLLVLVAFAGVLIRIMPILPIRLINYENLIHAHSHLAFLGWVYNALFAGMVHSFVKTGDQKMLSKYDMLFWITQAVTICMFFAFLLDGYRTPAIIALSIHTVLMYVFVGYFLNDFLRISRGVSVMAIITALLTLVISTLGPFAIPIIKVNSLNPDHIKMAVNFYLHFQYNGWFVFGVLALIFHNMPEVIVANKKVRKSLWMLIVGVIPTYFLSIQWVGLRPWVSGLAFFGSLLQLVGVWAIVLVLIRYRKQWTPPFGDGMGNWIVFGFIVFGIKSLFLSLSYFEEIYAWVFQSRNIMIAYLHWHFLGFITLVLLILFSQTSWWNPRLIAYHVGIRIFIIGFLTQEVYLFILPFLAKIGISTSSIHLHLLLSASILLFAGVLVLWVNGMKLKVGASR